MNDNHIHARMEGENATHDGEEEVEVGKDDAHYRKTKQENELKWNRQ